MQAAGSGAFACTLAFRLLPTDRQSQRVPALPAPRRPRWHGRSTTRACCSARSATWASPTRPPSRPPPSSTPRASRWGRRASLPGWQSPAPRAAAAAAHNAPPLCSPAPLCPPPPPPLALPSRCCADCAPRQLPRRGQDDGACAAHPVHHHRPQPGQALPPLPAALPEGRTRRAACALHQPPAPDLPTRRCRPAPQVREYCERQWSKILAGRVSVADFVFAKEVCCRCRCVRGLGLQRGTARSRRLGAAA